MNDRIDLGNKVKIYDGGSKVAEIDDFTDDGYLVNIEFPHHKIHRGKLFTLSYYGPIANLATGQVLFYRNHAATTKCHVEFELSNGADCLLQGGAGMLDVGSLGGGTPMRLLNHLLVNTTTSPPDSLGIWGGNPLFAFSGYSNPLLYVFVPGGKGANAVGGSKRSDGELIMTPSNEDCLIFSITNLTSQTANFGMRFSFYEVSV